MPLKYEVPNKRLKDNQWLGGKEIREAFRTTQQQMHANYPAEPYKWAAFVLVE